jgi:hypothetical protein
LTESGHDPDNGKGRTTVVHGRGRHRDTRRRGGLFPLLALAAATFLGPWGTKVLAAPLPAPALDLEASYETGWVTSYVRVPEGAPALEQRREVADSLRRGLRSQIVFQMRVYAPGSGFAALLGDELLAEMTIARTVSYDPFARWYVLEERVGSGEPERQTEADAARLLEAFFTAGGDRLLSLRSPPPRGSYIAARYRFTPVQVDGTLRIVSLFFDVGARTSPWARHPLVTGP